MSELPAHEGTTQSRPVSLAYARPGHSVGFVGDRGGPPHVLELGSPSRDRVVERAFGACRRLDR